MCRTFVVRIYKLQVPMGGSIDSPAMLESRIRAPAAPSSWTRNFCNGSQAPRTVVRPPRWQSNVFPTHVAAGCNSMCLAMSHHGCARFRFLAPTQYLFLAATSACAQLEQLTVGFHSHSREAVEVLGTSRNSLSWRMLEIGLETRPQELEIGLETVDSC